MIACMTLTHGEISEGKVTRNTEFAFFQWIVVLPLLGKPGMLLGYSGVLLRPWSSYNRVWCIVSVPRMHWPNNEEPGMLDTHWLSKHPPAHCKKNVILVWVSLGFVDQLSPLYPLWHPSPQKTMRLYEIGVKWHFNFLLVECIKKKKQYSGGNWQK